MQNRVEAKTHNGHSVIGKVKIGMKAKSATGKEYPTSVDYFIATGNHAGIFAEKLGEKPSAIKILFTDDESAFLERWEYRDKSGKLFGFGDGNEFMIWTEVQKNKKTVGSYQQFFVKDHPDLMERVHQKNNGSGWYLSLTLNFLIPESGILGLWQFTTKGHQSTIPNIMSTIDLVNEHHGTIVGVPFILDVKFQKSQQPGSSAKYPVISLTLDANEKMDMSIQGSQESSTEAAKTPKMDEVVEHFGSIGFKSE